MRVRRVLAITLTLIMMSVLPTVASTNHSNILTHKGNSDANTLVPLIIQAENGLQEKHKVLIKNSGGKLRHNLSLIKAFSVELPLGNINEFRNDDSVISIYPDSEVQACLDTAIFTTNALNAWGSGFTAKGITVAIVDTGIYPHRDLVSPVNRIIGFKDLVSGRTLPYDDNGHGTHVAGIVAGNGISSGGIYKGVAPEANLVGVKVLDNFGRGRTSDVIAGIQWVVQTKGKFNTRILNLSVGATPTGSYSQDPLSRAAEAALQEGIVVVAAAGNTGEGGIASPGINPNVITVGATDDKGTISAEDDVVAGFSSRGPTIDGILKPDLVAPGVGITSLKTSITNKPIKSNGTDGKLSARVSSYSEVDGYVPMSGTSMATPIVSGISAVLLQMHPDYSPEELKTYLIETATDLGFQAYEQGAGEAKIN